MDLYKKLNLTTIRSKPNLWIGRLVIFEKLSPEPVMIRDIALSCGLNIIWAEEPNADDPTIEITGHSAGKTTFCRLIRYVLGEKTFGTKVNMELIGKTLPDGYIAAEIYVAGKRWAVRRPFGLGRMSYAVQGVTIEQLLRQHGGAVPQDNYPKKIGLDELLPELQIGHITRTGEAIQWGHLLAWCTRDQEARYQDIHDWRSPRSDSESPAFLSSKKGPLFLMRAALGLFLPDELESEEKFSSLEVLKKELETKIEIKMREPDYWVNHYDTELRSRIRKLLPNEHGIETLPLHTQELLPDLSRLIESTVDSIKQAIVDSETKYAQLQEQIDGVGAEIRENENELKKLEALFDVDKAANNEIGERQGVWHQLEALQDKKCLPGDVLFSECHHVATRRNQLRIDQIQDAGAMQQAEAQRINEKRKLEYEKSILSTAIQELEKKRTELKNRRDGITVFLRNHRGEMEYLEQTFNALESWTKRRDNGAGYDGLVHLRQQLEAINSEIEGLKSELENFLRRHDADRGRLASIFSGAVQTVCASDAYEGEVSLDRGELAFHITHGTAMSGEAMGTLAILLSDIASLVFSSVSETAHLPGFMLHDSPREADLALNIYENIFRFVVDLQQHYGSADACPFQYIITTTTPPPVELRNSDFLKLKLNAAKPQELLLRRNIAIEAKRAESSLFPESDTSR